MCLIIRASWFETRHDYNATEFSLLFTFSRKITTTTARYFEINLFSCVFFLFLRRFSASLTLIEPDGSTFLNIFCCNQADEKIHRNRLFRLAQFQSTSTRNDGALQDILDKPNDCHRFAILSIASHFNRCQTNISVLCTRFLFLRCYRPK